LNALPGFEVFLPLVSGEGFVEGDVVFDPVEPFSLLGAEALVLAAESPLVVLLDDFGDFGCGGFAVGLAGFGIGRRSRR